MFQGRAAVAPNVICCNIITNFAVIIYFRFEMLNRPFVVVVLSKCPARIGAPGITFKRPAQLDKTYYNIIPYFEILAFDVAVLSRFGSISIWHESLRPCIFLSFILCGDLSFL